MRYRKLEPLVTVPRGSKRLKYQEGQMVSFLCEIIPCQEHQRSSQGSWDGSMSPFLSVFASLVLLATPAHRSPSASTKGAQNRHPGSTASWVYHQPGRGGKPYFQDANGETPQPRMPSSIPVFSSGVAARHLQQPPLMLHCILYHPTPQLASVATSLHQRN